MSINRMRQQDGSMAQSFKCLPARIGQPCVRLNNKGANEHHRSPGGLHSAGQQRSHIAIQSRHSPCQPHPRLSQWLLRS